MLSEGDSLNSQPEKTLRHFSSLPRTITCTNDPVYCSGSQGAVVSQAFIRTTTSPIRTASPGFIVRSR